MSQKYGLQLRGPPSSARKPQPLKRPAIFSDDAEDEEDVEEAIARHASKNKALKDVEQQHKSALEQDPTIFDYDAVYDEMKSKSARTVKEDPARNKPKYITKLLEKAKVRQQEHDIIYERKLAKERAVEDHMFGNKEKFVTSAYKKKLAEQAMWLEEERLRELREEAEEVTKKSDISDFYRNLLSKNVAYGAGTTKVKDETVAMQGPPQPQQDMPAQTLEAGRHSSSSNNDQNSRQDSKAQIMSEEAERYLSKASEAENANSPNRAGLKSVSGPKSGLEFNPSVGPKVNETSVEPSQLVTVTAAATATATEKLMVTTEKSDALSDSPITLPIEHKPTADALDAAKERYLARKRMRTS